MQRSRILETFGLAVTIAVLGTGLTALPAVADTQVVSSADFESGSQGPWGVRGSTLAIVDTDAHSGTHSLSVTGRSGNWAGIAASSTALGLAVGTEYTFSAWVKLAADVTGTSGLKFTSEEHHADGTSNSYTQINPVITTDAGAWKQITGSYTLPAGLTDATIYVEAADIADTHPSFLVDDVLVTTEAAPSTPVTKTVSSAGFEDGSQGPWGPRGSTLAIVDTDAHTGTHSVAVTARAGNWAGIAASDTALGLTVGTEYTFSAWVKLAPDVTGTSALHFTAQENHADGSSTGYTWIGSPTDTDSGTWQQLTGTYTLPAGLSDASIYIEAADIDGTHPSYLVDELLVTTEVVDTPPTPGTVLANDFETDLGGWKLRDGGTGTTASVALTTATAHGGAQAAVVTGRAGQGDGIGHDVTGLLASGTTYELTAWLRFGDGQPADEVWLSRADTRDGTTAYTTITRFTTVTATGWTKVTASIPGSSADDSLLYFETRWDNGAVGNTSELYLDDVELSIPAPPVVEDLPGIKDSVPFPVGVAIDSRETAGPAAELLERHFDQVTPENFMKPETWYNADHSFVTTNAEADALMTFAQANGIRVYGHTLAWHSQTPAWFFQDDAGNPLPADATGRAVLTQRLRDHIDGVSKYLYDRYGAFGSDTNPLVAFDVVNEVIADGTDTDDGLRRSEWYRILGESYIDLAFQFANEDFNGTYAAEGVSHPITLFINDYNTEQSGKQQRLHDLVARLIARGVPVDGVGHQFHITLTTPVSALDRALTAFDDLPVKQAITELDVVTGTPVTQAKLIDQGYYFRDAFNVFRAHSDRLFSVTVWGLTDGRSWRSSSGAPLIFNDQLKAKPAYFGAVDGTLPPLQRAANVFQGDVPLNASATSSPEWQRLPLIPVDEAARFQLRWAPDHLTVYASVDDATAEAGDGIALTVGTAEYTVPRTGADPSRAVVAERAGGYDVVAQVPLADAAIGQSQTFDLRVTDGTTTHGWNSPGAVGTLSYFEPLSYTDVVAASAVPTIDGDVDAEWTDANVVTTDRNVQGTGGALATVRTLWKDHTLYVLAQVADPTVDVSASDPWVQDSVEIYVDGGNAKNGAYRADDTQIRISAQNRRSFGTGDEATQQSRVQSAAKIVDGGYVVEAAIDLLGYAGAGTFQGLDFQVNDATAGVRTAIRNWADPTGTGYQTTAHWGVGRLAEPKAVFANTGKPGIRGDVVKNETVTADPGTWSIDGATFAYQWTIDGTPIKKATGASYKISGSDAGKRLGVTVTATLAGFDPITVSSDAVTVLDKKPVVLVNTVKPSITGVAALGATVKADPGKWSVPGAKFAYQWTLDGAPIAKATGSSYQIRASDLGKQLGVDVTATAKDAAPVTVSADPVALPAPVVLVNTVKPSISGKAEKNGTVTANPGTWSVAGAAYSYQWTIDGKAVKNATASSYTATSSDVGKRLGVTVTASVPGAAPVSASSDTVVVQNGRTTVAEVVQQIVKVIVDVIVDLLGRLFR